MGITPLQALLLFRKQSGFILPESLCYAGRLDPLAEGLLPIVEGKNLKLKDSILALPKLYRAEILIGASTDSGDLLGEVIAQDESVSLSANSIKLIVENLKGEHELAMPRYNSISISRNSIIALAGSELLPEKIVRMMNCLDVVFIGQKRILISEVLNKLLLAKERLDGNFRHETIQKSWEAVGKTKRDFEVLELEFLVTSGTYIRSLAEYMGKLLSVPTCLFSLVRERVGSFQIEDAFVLALDEGSQTIKDRK